MATPVFKFQHPELKGENLYFIYNTFWDQPETIPMDLATFIFYHLSTNRTLSGFCFSWKNLKNKGASLQNQSYEEFFDSNLRLKHFDSAKVSGVLETALHNSPLSKRIDIILNQYSTNSDYEDSIFDEIDFSKLHNFRELDYYKSLSYTYDMLAKYNSESQYEDGDKMWWDEFQSDPEEYLKQFDDFPLNLVPHKYRANGHFAELCRKRNKHNLIP